MDSLLSTLSLVGDAEIVDISLSKDLQSSLISLLDQAKDPYSIYKKTNKKEAIEKLLDAFDKPEIVGVVDAGLVEEEQVIKPPKKDAILDNFITGANGVFAGSKNLESIPTSTPIVVRGIAKKRIIQKAAADGRDFYYIDTGYFGNQKTKLYHRCVKNSLQFNVPLWKDCPDDRFKRTNTEIHSHTPGESILLCPPSQKALNFWNVDLQEWLTSTVREIKKYTKRPIVIREKQNRNIRTNEDTMEMALSRDVHCLVTYNSIAAVEALIYGKPVFTMGPNAALPLANTDLSKINSPMMPTRSAVRQLCCNLAYGQFTSRELVNGTAWRILNEFYNRK